MSENDQLSKKQLKRRKQAEKRKANSSIEFNSSDRHSSDNTPCTPTYTHSLTNPCIDQDYYNSSYSYVSSVMQQNQNTSPVMNYSQHIPYGFGPGTPGIVSASTPMTAPPGNMIPPWASELIADVKALKVIIPQVDEIRKDISSIHLKMSEFDSRITQMETQVTETEKSCSFICGENDDRKHEISIMQQKLKDFEKMSKNVDSVMNAYEQKTEKINDEILDIKARSMRENLLFYGIKESSTNEKENCEQLVKDMINCHLQLDAKNITLDRVHRLGPKRSNRIRPIVAKFHNYSTRETVRLKSLETDIKTRLSDHDLGIGVQTPKEYRDARNAFKPLIKEAEDRGQSVRVAGNKLIINKILTKKFMNGKLCDPNHDSD